MNEKCVLVVAKHTEVDGVFTYAGYLWTVGDDGKGTFGTEWARDLIADTYRTIRFDVKQDLSWRASADEVGDCRYERWNASPYETPEIASDDVGNDMLEVAKATAWPQEYSEQCRKEEHEAEEARKNEIARKHRLYEYGC